jgi:glutamine synthetase
MPEMLAMTAASVPSYYRLTPHRWSAAFTNLARQDREAGVRICPVFDPKDDADTARKFHFEFRAADAAASPYLVLAAILNAGLSGLDDGLPTPPVTDRDLADADAATLAGLAVERLAGSLSEALDRMPASAWARAAFGADLIDAIDRHKRAEIGIMDGLSKEEICARYAAAY